MSELIKGYYKAIDHFYNIVKVTLVLEFVLDFTFPSNTICFLAFTVPRFIVTFAIRMRMINGLLALVVQMNILLQFTMETLV